MIYHLVCQSPIVLQDVVVFCSDCLSDLLRNRQNIGELVVRNVSQLRAVVFGYD